MWYVKLYYHRLALFFLDWSEYIGLGTSYEPGCKGKWGCLSIFDILVQSERFENRDSALIYFVF